MKRVESFGSTRRSFVTILTLNQPLSLPILHSCSVIHTLIHDSVEQLIKFIRIVRGFIRLIAVWPLWLCPNHEFVILT